MSAKGRTKSVNHRNESLFLSISETHCFTKLKNTIGSIEVNFTAECYKLSGRFAPPHPIKLLGKCKGITCPLHLEKRRVRTYFSKSLLFHVLSVRVVTQCRDCSAAHLVWAVKPCATFMMKCQHTNQLL